MYDSENESKMFIHRSQFNYTLMNVIISPANERMCS